MRTLSDQFFFGKLKNLEAGPITKKNRSSWIAHNDPDIQILDECTNLSRLSTSADSRRSGENGHHKNIQAFYQRQDWQLSCGHEPCTRAILPICEVTLHQ